MCASCRRLNFNALESKYGGQPIKKFDIVFADPPYDLDIETYKKIPNLVIDNQWLEEGGNFVLEHPSSISFEEHPNFVQHKKYGNVHFSFFE